MYYHVLVETSDKNSKRDEYEKLYRYNILDENIIKKDFIIPYLNKQKIWFSGRNLGSENIRRLIIKQTSEEIDIVAKNLTAEYRNKHPYVVFSYSKEYLLLKDMTAHKEIKDITDDIIKSCLNNNNAEKKIPYKSQNNNKNIFIVHGHDEEMKQTVARFLEHVGLNPIILSEQANEGQTIIEKLEKNIENCNYGVVLYSPCDKGGINKEKSELKFRARQNVVLEHGFLMGKFGRKNVCCIIKDNIEKPSDSDGILYIPYADGWDFKLARELKTVGYDIDLNKLA